MAVGAGKLSHYLTDLLTASGKQVMLIDRSHEACERAAEDHQDAIVIEGDATNQDLLLEEGLDQMDAFISMTGFDEMNIFLSLFAMRHAQIKTVTKVTHIQIDETLFDVDLETTINPKKLSAEYTIRHVRALASRRGSNVETVHKLAGDKAEALEFRIELIGRPLMTFRLKRRSGRHDQARRTSVSAGRRRFDSVRR
ncbi:NAD-binding protein [Allobaculum mucilyticum]|uniref:NAD-binding protein n=1 Tax=Allobaculum mucilyticum TaxID=2834459 RepID=UPI001E5A3C35|nr:NAD-binding protein [Allobaculum mucilyticum]UNT95405.1 NAD-binding protein [Allobaculum mucilyticum]